MTQAILLPLQLLLAIGVPMLIAWRVPRGWRVAAIVIWALAPLLIAVAIAGSEIVAGKSSPADIDKLIYGLLLIGSFLALPWLMACGIGYAIGAMLRGRRLSEAVAERPTVSAGPKAIKQAEPYSPPPIDPDAPTLSVRGGWQPVHVGFDHDELVLDGLPVWSLPWREEEATEPVMLAHPAHPTQRHAFSVYNIDDGFRGARFAAAELSNGVWGFYRWIVPADAVSGTSADGALRYEHELLSDDGRYSAVPLARLFDARTGRLLFDGAAWTSSRLVPQTDGTLLLSLEQGEWQAIFRIDPGAGTFVDLSVPGTVRSLAGLASAAAAARAECDDPARTYLGRRVAPDGSLRVDLAAAEWGNTHWVRSPRVIEIATGRVLLDLWGTDWDAVPGFPRTRTVRLSLRRYHHGGGAEIEIDLAGDRFALFQRSGTTVGPLSDVVPALEDAARKEAALAPPRHAIGQPRSTARGWLTAMLILVGALALIAAATVMTLAFHGEPPAQKLDTIPPMPAQEQRP